MRDLDNFYSKVLYPFQDGVIGILRILRTPFFLTGGTALARAYLGHRYSDDLDFFVNDDPRFLEYVRTFETGLLEAATHGAWMLDEGGTIRTDRFISFSLIRGEGQLKIDLVNDIAFRVGIPTERSIFMADLRTIANEILGLTDNDLKQSPRNL